MRIGTFVTVAAIVTTLTLSSSAAFAHGRGRGDHGDPKARAEKVSQMVKTELAPKLGVDDRTADRLVEVFQQQAEQRGTAMKQVREERKALEALVARKAAPGEYDAQNRKLEAALAAVPDRAQLFAATARLLSPEQQAKLVLTLPEIRRNHREDREGHHGGRGK